jgi:phosphoribosylformylglycinamidine cyclo-ligase
VLPAGLMATLHLGSWPVPPLFALIQSRAAVEPAEMYRVFNMGLGMLAVVARSEAAALRAALGEDTWVIGELSQGTGGVHLA